MTGKLAQILIVDDEVNIRTALAKILEKIGYSVRAAESGAEALELLKRCGCDLAIVDLRMARMDGLSLLKAIKEASPDTEVIIMTAYGSIETAVEAMKLGAYDYITKPIDQDRLPILVAKALEKQRLALENKRLRSRLSAKNEYGNLIGKSPAMAAVYKIVDQVASTNATILLQGESGVGKELVAKAIHSRSERRDKPFVTINCGALPESLLESELFGFEKGAFTGATLSKPGRIELANGGTLFLDEAAEMSPKTQVDFLRVLESREFRRIGGTKLIKVDLRFIAATNKHLEKEVAAGRFREDLYYRLNVVPITIPPLRERREDIPLLAEAFLQEFAEINRRGRKEISREAMKLLTIYPWPGNVRELRNLIEKLVVTVSDPVITPSHLPPAIRNKKLKEISIPLETTLEKIEEIVIKKTLEEVTDNRENAARILGISLRALYYKMKKYGINVGANDDKKS